MFTIIERLFKGQNKSLYVHINGYKNWTDGNIEKMASKYKERKLKMLEQNTYDTIRQVLQTLKSDFGTDIFDNSSRFMGGLNDVQIKADSKIIKNLLRIAVCDLHAYTRLKKSYDLDDIFAVGNIAKEMSDDFMLPIETTTQVIECLALLIGFKPSSTLPIAKTEKENNNDDAEQNRIQQKRFELKEQRIRISKFQGCVAACSNRTLGLKTNGTVVATGDVGWGSNSCGQLYTSDWRNINSIYVTGIATIGICSNGAVYVAGTEDFNKASSWRNIIMIALSDETVIGLKNDGTVVAVGDNRYGQCNIEGWRNIVSVFASSLHTVGLRADGKVVATGDNQYGQCHTENWENIISIGTSFYHTIGLMANGSVVATGRNQYGECNVEKWSDIIEIHTSPFHTVGLKADGTVVATGENKHDEDKCCTEDWNDIIAVCTSRNYTVGLNSDGTIVVAGSRSRSNGKDLYIGSMKFGNCKTDSWESIVAISASDSHIVGLKENGSLVSEWYGVLGSGNECNTSRWRGIGHMPEEVKSWIAKGLCKHCGGNIGGIFAKKCKLCGQLKD
jgi:alpha-tubulin suppressor-like RCC1 family protein